MATYRHPTLPFIEVTITKIEPAPEDGRDVLLWAGIGGDTVRKYRTNASCTLCSLPELFRWIEEEFFLNGIEHLWRGQLAAAAESGDLATLATMAEGHGYWRGVMAVLETYSNAERHADDAWQGEVPTFQASHPLLTQRPEDSAIEIARAMREKKLLRATEH